MTKACLLPLFFLIAPSLWAQVCYHINDDEGGVPSAYLFINGTFASVTDSDGNVFISGVNKGDTIRVSHLAYVPFEYVLLSEPKDTSFTLSPLYFDIDEASYVKDFDYDILKEKIQEGLSNGHFGGRVPYISNDTISIEDKKLFVEENGIVSFPLVGFKVLRHNAMITGTENSQKSSLSREEIIEMKEMLISKIANAVAYSEYICKCKKYKGIRVEYRGNDDCHDIFYFFVPPQDYVGRTKNSKFRGLAYINSITGILEYITATFASGDFDKSYEVNVKYHYLEESNSILPEVIRHTSYLMWPDGTLKQTYHSHIELDWASVQ